MKTYYTSHHPFGSQNGPDQDESFTTTPFETASRLIVSAYYGRKPAILESFVKSPDDILSNERHKLEHRPRNLNNPSERRLCVTLLKIKIREEVAGLIGGLLCSAARFGWTPELRYAGFPKPTHSTTPNHGSFGGYVHDTLEKERYTCKSCSEMVTRNMYWLGQLDLLVDGPPACLCCLYQESADIIVREWDFVCKVATALGNSSARGDYDKFIQPLFNKALSGLGR